MKILITGGSGFIGTNLQNQLINLHYEFLNIDKNAPKIKDHLRYWKKVNLLDINSLSSEVFDFKPDFIIHLAARTDIYGKSLDDYSDNVKGTENLINVIARCKFIRRLILTSTQYVNQNKEMPKDDLDFKPHTIYGESKVINEKVLRKANLSCEWVIVRPTNIWGPWHPRYPHEFWRIIAEHKYLHPNVPGVIRSYGFVDNVAWQYIALLNAQKELIDRQVFYLGDKPILLEEWVNGFSKAQIGHPVKKINVRIIKILAKIGDILFSFNIKFPITTSRLNNMITSNGAPMDKTFNILGSPPLSLDEGITITVKWLMKEYPNLVKVKI